MNPPASRFEQAEILVTARLRGTRHQVRLEPEETILAALRRHELKPPFFCTRGNCGTCLVRVTEGSVDMKINRALTAAEVAGGLALACQSRPTTPAVTVEFLGG